MSVRAKVAAWIVALLPLVLFAAFYSRLPRIVAMQWSIWGTPDWYASRAAFGLFLLITPVLAFLLTEVKPMTAKLSATRPWPLWAVFGLLALSSAASLAALASNLR